MTEYLIGTILLFSALFLPIPPGDQSAVEILLAAINRFQSNTTYQLSMP